MHTQDRVKKMEISIGEAEIKKLLLNIKRNPSVDNWNLFYTFTKCEVLCEAYDQWREVQELITGGLSSNPPPPTSSPQNPVSSEVPPSEISILVAGCGNSKMSEHLYDAGFTNITNVDFSDVVIKHMLKHNVRERPLMKWRVMYLTDMQFANETFDAILDNGGLDAVMDDPLLNLAFGHFYLSEVKRLLKPTGKYICVTMAEPKVLGVLFPRFRYGWKVSTYAIISGDINKNVFMTFAWKLAGSAVSNISVFQQLEESDNSQARAFNEALERENISRKIFSDAFNPFVPLEDLKTNIKELEPGRRVKHTLGEPGVSNRFYNCILLDAQQDSGPFSVPLLVVIVPNLCHLEWITTSSKEQWRYVEHFKTARLLMVIGPKNDVVLNEQIQKDISTLVKKVSHENCDKSKILFVVATDGIKKKKTVHQVTSDLSGLIVVEDLIYDNDHMHHDIPDKDSRVRCLTVASVERSKALLTREEEIGSSSEVEKKKIQATSKTKKKGKNKKSHSQSSQSQASSGVFKVDHSHLKNTRHTAFISGLLLICIHLKESSPHRMVKRMFIGNIPVSKLKTVIIGLGAGILPMFMKQVPYFTTEVVEADPAILDVAREYFGFIEDECVKVNITDGIQFVNEKANCNAEGSGSSKIDILIIDVDTPDPKSVLTSPPIEFVEKPFLLTVKNALSEDGFFIINLSLRSITGKRIICKRLKEVFTNLISLEIEKDVNEVIVCFNSDSPTNEDHLSKACNELAICLEIRNLEWCQGIADASKLFKPLK